MRRNRANSISRYLPADALLAGSAVSAFAVAWWLAPTESTMGHVQRILYLHVPLAWLSLLACPAMAVTGAWYLWRRQLRADQWAAAIAELGWISSTLTLVTGSCWAHDAWGTWWTWDPRLTTAFILWAVYCGVLLLRRTLPEGAQRARAAAMLAIVGTVDVPLIVMATRWFRGIHPVSPQLEPAMRLALLLSAVGFLCVFVMLLRHRHAQLQLERAVAELTQRMACPAQDHDCDPHSVCLITR